MTRNNYGFVTTPVAAASGIPAGRLVQLADRGTLERVSRGVYRLVRFPPSPRDSYVAATLWPTGTTGVLCHDTALDLYDVCEINPDKVHVCVPTTHRIRRSIPKLYEMHHLDLAPAELAEVKGLQTTTLVRTIADCASSGVGTYLLEQAITNGAKQGLLTRAEARAATGRITQADLGDRRG